MSRLDFLYRQELPHRAVSVYTYLADRANKDGECWPAIPTIASELKLSQSTVRRALHDLRKADCSYRLWCDIAVRFRVVPLSADRGAHVAR